MSDKPKTLEDLVPPLELCKAAREVIGERTALVWQNIEPSAAGAVWEVVSSADSDGMMNKRDEYTGEFFYPDMVQIPAPTLAELLEIMMENEYLLKHPQVHHDGPDWAVRAFVPGALMHYTDAKNPATAALRLLVKVKGVE